MIHINTFDNNARNSAHNSFCGVVNPQSVDATALALGPKWSNIFGYMIGNSIIVFTSWTEVKMIWQSNLFTFNGKCFQLFKNSFNYILL